MKVQKMLSGVSVLCFAVVCLWGYAFAGSWDQCKDCHNGALAPDAKELKEKYKTVDDLVKAAKKSDDPSMGRFKKEVNLLKEAAKEIGLK